MNMTSQLTHFRMPPNNDIFMLRDKERQKKKQVKIVKRDFLYLSQSSYLFITYKLLLNQFKRERNAKMQKAKQTAISTIIETYTYFRIGWIELYSISKDHVPFSTISLYNYH